MGNGVEAYRADEMLLVLRELWTEGWVEHHGDNRGPIATRADATERFADAVVARV